MQLAGQTYRDSRWEDGERSIKGFCSIQVRYGNTLLVTDV